MTESPSQPPADLPLRSLPAKGRRVLPFIILAAVVAAFTILFYQVMRPFVLPLFLAATLAMLTYPLKEYLSARLRNRNWLAAGILTLIVVLVVVGPLATAIALGVRELYGALDHIRDLSTEQGRFVLLDPAANPWLAEWLQSVYESTGIEADQLRAWLLQFGGQAGTIIYQRSINFLSDLPGIVVSFITFLLGFYFFLKDGPRILEGWEQLTPMDAEHDRVIREEFAKVCRGVVWSSLVAALAQGTLFGLGLFLTDWIAGVGVGRWTFLLSLLTVAAAMVPLFGSAAIWVPTCIGIFLQGHHVAAVVLAIYCGLVVSNVDTLIKVYVLGDTVKLHPLLIFVSVFGGIDVFGVLGIFIGPIVAAVLIALLRILKKEIMAFSRAEEIAGAVKSEQAHGLAPAGLGKEGT